MLERPLQCRQCQIDVRPRLVEQLSRATFHLNFQQVECPAVDVRLCPFADVGKLLDDGSIRTLDVSVGDKVLFGKYAGTEIKIDGEDRTILREEDVLGIVQD